MNLAVAVLFGCATAGLTLADSFSEPSTVFYGKVLAIGSSGPPQLLTQGNLTWHILMQSGEELELTTTLYALNKGQFSYRLDIPHRALSLGLVVDGSAGVIPLSSLAVTNRHFDIRVDGQPAEMIGPAGSTFELKQARRAALYRLDLAIEREPLDSDGDGIPDWWEDANGLDKQDPDDALLDPDRDGLNNLSEFEQGLDPTRDSTLPLLVTRELMIYADGTTGVLLETLDIDSSPEQLTYTLTRAPEAGTLLIRNRYEDPEAPDEILAQGATFTQADVRDGRLIFAYNDAGERPIPFEVSVADEVPGHEAAAGGILLFPYRPSGDLAERTVDLSEPVMLAGGTRLVVDMAADEDRRLKNYLLSRTGAFEVRDASHSIVGQIMSSPSAGLDALAYESVYVAAYGPDLRQILIGGRGADVLSGSMEGDVLIGGASDDVLRGNGGADWFVWQCPEPGHDTVEDFSVADNDVLDLSDVIDGDAPFIDDYLQLEWSADGPSALRVDTDGDGSGTDFVISLGGLSESEADLGYLVEHGHLVVDGLNVKPRVTVLTLQATASENGPKAGSFILSRTGSLDDDLVVLLQIDGSAANGIDYSRISQSIIIPAGQASVVVTVTPFADSETEADETVQLLVLPSADYFVGMVDRASVTIEDLKVLIEIEALEPLAVKDTLTPGVFLVTRSAILDRSVLVRLQIGGTATGGVDYQAISAYVNMVPYQTTALIEVKPLAGADLYRGRESVIVSILEDAAYRVGARDQARVILIDGKETLSQWRDKYFPDFDGTLEEFAMEDSGGHGISHLLRYAYGMDVHDPDPSRMPKFYLSNGRIRVDLFRNPAATDIEYKIAVSSDLENWDDSSISVEEVEVEDAGADPAASCFQSRELTESERKLFMRIEVREKP